MHQPFKIVITGAESTGKTSLARALALHYGVRWVPEFAREYVESLQRKYNYCDIEKVARKQILDFCSIGDDEPLVFIDTWLIITKVWFDKVYGHHPEWLHHAILGNPVDLFLVCDTDLPWVADPVRENGGEARQLLHETYLKEIGRYGFEYKIVSGFEKQRLRNAINLIDCFINKS